MTRLVAASLVGCLCVAGAGGCRDGASDGAGKSAGPPPRVAIVPVSQQTVSDVLKVTGTLVAERDAEVAAETTGRVVATPVERGSRVAQGGVLVSLSKVEAEAQALEAAANVAQLEARLALAPDEPFDVERVAEVSAARASRDLAEAEFNRVKSLLDERVVSQAEFDQRRTQLQATSNQYAAARNAALQQYRMLDAARARAELARKNLADTDVKAPFRGVVVERKVGVGDFVTRGTKVASLVQVSPLRLEITVPEQSIRLVKTGEPVRLWVDAFPDRAFSGQLRYVSPALRADQRALTVEAVVPNEDGALKPGMFATAELRLPSDEPSLVVPTAAVLTIEGISRVYVIHDGVAEERIVTAREVSDGLTAIGAGLSAGEEVAIGELSRLRDGLRVQATRGAAAGPGGAPASR